MKFSLYRFAFVFGFGLSISACVGESTVPVQREQDLAGQCRISGDPPVTTGCKAGEQCTPHACTDSIPPTCVGTCEAAATLAAQRCDVNGDPPVTTGCKEGQVCAVEACTDSIPPHCWGTCQ